MAGHQLRHETMTLLLLTSLLLGPVLGCGSNGDDGGGGPADAGEQGDGASSEDASLGDLPLPGELVINEVAARPASPGQSDWVELLSLADRPLQLGGCTLVDDNPDHAPEPLPSLLLQPGGFVLLSAGGDTPPDDSAGSLSFGLGRDDALTLACAEQQVDQVDWVEGDAPDGSSWGRLPDGSENLVTMRPTPGQPNELFSE